MPTTVSIAAPLPGKPHYPILDGLRGVASLMVVMFHVFEASSTSHLDQIINHGYLAVDFFFLLSGFVIGYAYDDRWGKMTVAGFFKRRLIRLQPMVIMGTIVGAAFFYFHDSGLWPGIHIMPWWKTIGIMLIGFTMLPVPPSMDIRGWNEMYPLNGPAWSLFFEYVANILYALVVRRFGKIALTILAIVSAGALIRLAIVNGGDVVGGWSTEWEQLEIGITRVMYPFFAGLLLFRIGRLGKVKHAFWWCSLLVVVVLAVPRIGGGDRLWMNGLYDSLAIILVFPLIVYLGASGEVRGRFATSLCKFFGDISYPLYITHYPIIYLYTAWVIDNKVPMSRALPVGLVVFVSAIVLAYGCLKLYDEPVRRWLQKRLQAKKSG